MGCTAASAAESKDADSQGVVVLLIPSVATKISSPSAARTAFVGDKLLEVMVECFKAVIFFSATEGNYCLGGRPGTNCGEDDARSLFSFLQSSKNFNTGIYLFSSLF